MVALRMALLAVFLLVAGVYNVRAQNLLTSEQARFTLVTVGPGDDLYNCFGHSALRLHDPAKGMDIVFNYGTFDFNTPNFALRFAKGNLPYMLSVQYTNALIEAAQEERRFVYERALNLTPQQVQKLADFLADNYRPENRTYAYNFFTDNCATRIRNAIAKTLGNEVLWDTARHVPSTFRKLFNRYSAAQPWADFGMNIGLGLPADRAAGPWQAAFLPDSLDALFAHARLQQGTTTTKPLTSDKIILLNQPERHTGPNVPFYVFMLLALVTISVSAAQRLGKLPRALAFLNSPWWDRLLFGVVGLLGIVLLLLWLATDHHDTAWNPNLLWALPTHLLLAFVLPLKPKTEGRRNLFMGYLIVCTCLACATAILALVTHWLPIAVVWLALLLLVRLGMLLRSLQSA